MTEPLPDVKALTREQTDRAIAVSERMRADYWGLYSAARVIIHLQDELAESQQLLNSEWFNRVTYKQQARAAQAEVARLETHIIERQPMKVTEPCIHPWREISINGNGQPYCCGCNVVLASPAAPWTSQPPPAAPVADYCDDCQGYHVEGKH